MTSPFPNELFDFAFFPFREDALNDLAGMAEDESWDYENTPSPNAHPILFNYLKYTYKRLSEEGKISLSRDGAFACWNTGLVTSAQEPIYGSFKTNRNPDREPWVFDSWNRKGEWKLNAFDLLPDMAHYFDDPSQLVLDTRLDFRVNVEHIIEDNRERFPEQYKSMPDFQMAIFLNGAIESARSRVRRNYKAAIPQYYNGKVQLLLPLCISDPRLADLALVVERFANFYRASTCLTVDMAYNNARQLARPDKDWLRP